MAIIDGDQVSERVVGQGGGQPFEVYLLAPTDSRIGARCVTRTDRLPDPRAGVGGFAVGARVEVRLGDAGAGVLGSRTAVFRKPESLLPELTKLG